MKTKRLHNKIVIQRLMLGAVEHSTKVTALGKGLWGCRVFVNGVLNQEIVVDNKADICKAIRSMLRMEDKCGNISKMASSSRMRK
jgi:hypothetical protein